MRELNRGKRRECTKYKPEMQMLPGKEDQHFLINFIDFPLIPAVPSLLYSLWLCSNNFCMRIKLIKYKNTLDLC